MNMHQISSGRRRAFFVVSPRTFPREGMSTFDAESFLRALALNAALRSNPARLSDTATITSCAVDRTEEVLGELDALLRVENSNGYTFQASRHAYENARAYLESIRFSISSDFRYRPTLIPDGEGGIDIEWESGRKRVAISCRANQDQQDCIYWREVGAGNYEARDVSPDGLRDRLTWLFQA
jgi:hypothetical protein